VKKQRCCYNSRGEKKKAFRTAALAQLEVERIERKVAHKMNAYPCEAHGWHVGSMLGGFVPNERFKRVSPIFIGESNGAS
jgi:hypothetical protein